MRIRPLQPADVSAVAAMLGAMEPWISYRVDAAAWERLLRALPATEQGFVATADDCDEIVGYVQFRQDGAFALSGYIRTLGIRQVSHGQGLGRDLLAFAEAQMLARGPNVFLLCSAQNTAAQAFYRRCGYVEVGRLESYVLPGEDEIIFRKSTGPIRK